MDNETVAGTGAPANPAVKVIAPTVGRVVHYYVASTEAANGMAVYDLKTPMAAHVAYVHSDICVNLMVIDHSGAPWQRTSVPINQVAGATAWAEWMPYQLGQAAKTEAALASQAAGKPA